MGYTGLNCSFTVPKGPNLATIPIPVTATVIADMEIVLPITSYGVVIMYLDGTFPQISGVGFTLVGNVISWLPGSWFDTELEEDETLYIVYSTAPTAPLVNDTFVVDATIRANRYLNLTNIPTNTATLYVDGSAPLLEDTEFNISGSIASWSVGSWLDTYLVDGDTLHFVY